MEGVFTTDPNICEKARKIDAISYDEMLELASLGSKVLHNRSVELAKKYHLELQRLAGKKVVDNLNLYQYDYDSALIGGSDVKK